MSMIMRKRRCRVCGKEILLTYPEMLSDEGVMVISVCKVCRAKEVSCDGVSLCSHDEGV